VLDIVNFDKGNDFHLYTQRFQTYVTNLWNFLKKQMETKIKSKGTFIYEYRGL